MSQRARKTDKSPKTLVSKATASIEEICDAAKGRVLKTIQEHYDRHKTSPWTGRQLVNLEKTLSKVYADWGKDIKEEFRESLPEVMQTFYDDAKKAMATDGRYKAIIGTPDKDLVKRFLESAFEQVAMRTDKMQHEHISILRRIAAAVFRDTSLTGDTRREVSKRMLEKALSISGFEFIDRSGKTWRWESYFEMLARTELMNAGRETYDKECAEDGYDVMVLSYSGNPCPKCKRYEGKMFSLSGATPGMPSKDDLIANGVFHPNCTHSYSAVPLSRLPKELAEEE
jgi:hypothetical protein